MAFTLYASSDANAPVLDGQVGSLVTVLDAVLVNGYTGKPLAGWTINQTATNKRAYRNDSGAGSGMVWRIDDSGPGVAGAQEARLVGYESMSDIDTGVRPFPSVAQKTNGVFIRKSAAADATARDWWIVADSLTCYMCIDSGDGGYSWFTIGDFESRLSGDAYAAYTQARNTENSALLAVGTTYECFGAISQDRTANTRMYAARSYVGTTGSASTTMGVSKNYMLDTSGYALGGGLIAYPDPITGTALVVEKPILYEDSSNRYVRGYFRGLLAPMHQRPLSHGDTCSGTGALAGQAYVCLHVGRSGTAGDGCVLLETN